jgi:hypothetical protein
MKVRTSIVAGQGMGDAVADLAQLTGMSRLAETYEQITGKDCGCEARQEKLNQLLSLIPVKSNT